MTSGKRSKQLRQKARAERISDILNQNVREYMEMTCLDALSELSNATSADLLNPHSENNEEAISQIMNIMNDRLNRDLPPIPMTDAQHEIFQQLLNEWNGTFLELFQVAKSL